MLSAGFETTILAIKRPQTHAIDRMATGIGTNSNKNRPTDPTYDMKWLQSSYSKL
jgi:hypothetical protein